MSLVDSFSFSAPVVHFLELYTLRALSKKSTRTADRQNFNFFKQDLKKMHFIKLH